MALLQAIASGTKRYTYNTAGLFLTKGGDLYKCVAGAGRNGLRWAGQPAGDDRLRGRVECDHYLCVGGWTIPLASAGELTTAYLYGLGMIGEQTYAWAYTLPDGTNTPRQTVDASGAVTLTSSYTLWGDTLEAHGTGSFAYGYFGGIMDTATGFLYVGGGQYYDPQTGRFLNRSAQPDQSNPYVPWKSGPSGAMLAPIAMLALIYGGTRKRGKLDNLVIALVLLGAAGMSLSACGLANMSGAFDARIAAQD